MSQADHNPDNAPASPDRPLVIGICGGIASGKSVVTSQLEKLGAAVIRADLIGHQVLQLEEVRNALVDRFGSPILAPETMEVSRHALANLVFGDHEQAKQNRLFLEALTHPRIRQTIFETLEGWLSQATPLRAVVLDIPLLLESGYAPQCDEIIFIRTPLEQRLQHAAQRGWSESQYQARESAQMPLVEKEKRSTVIFENRGTLADLQSQVTQWFEARTGQPTTRFKQI